MDKLRNSAEGQGIFSLADVSELGRQTLQEGSQNDFLGATVPELESLWRRLHWTACSPSVVDKHLTSTCNAVCVFLRRACQVQQVEIKIKFSSRQVWSQAFEIVHKAFSDNKNKPALQVLDTLVFILHGNESTDAAREMLKVAIAEMMEIILTGSPARRLKEACIIVSILLKRTQDLVPFSEYVGTVDPEYRVKLERRCLKSHISLEHISALHQDTLGELFLALLLSASVSESQTAALKLFSLLCAKSEKLDFSANVATASQVIESYLVANKSALLNVSNNVFPTILDSNEKFTNFLESSGLSKKSSESQIAMYMAILQVGRQKAFISEEELPEVFSAGFLGKGTPPIEQHNKYAIFRHLMQCDALEIRLQAFRLLVTSNATNAPVPAGSLHCLSTSFRFLHDDTDAHYRDEYLSIARGFLNRLRRSNQAIIRKQGLSAYPNAQEIRTSYAAFVRSWLSFLQIELAPQVSYQRHILALHVLQLIVLVYGVDEVSDVLGTGEIQRLVTALIDLIFDAYDDVRSEAVSGLKLLSSCNNQLVTSSLSEYQVLSLGRRLSASTNRADHADAIGRAHALQVYVRSLSPGASPASVSKDAALDLAKSVEHYVNGILKISPVSTFPLHGTVLGLYHIINQSVGQEIRFDDTTLGTFLGLCHRIWALVKDDLCVDSPETATNEEDLHGTEGPKDLLAYSWRAVRDSSLLMQALLSTQSPSPALFEDIGSLCLEQLTDLRHRGAFSTVEQTFTLCCAQTRAMKDQAYSTLIQSWTGSAFNEIENQSTKLTRRSAGLPAMFAALLDPLDPSGFLSTVNSLILIATSKANANDVESSFLRLPQVHALNCLKDIMTHSRFRIATEALLVEMLNLASSSLSSSIWAIRNCGLMLFRACINRITPASSVLHGDHVLDSKIGTIRTPLEVAVHLLQKAPLHKSLENYEGLEIPETGEFEIVFAALDLISRISHRSSSNDVIDTLVTQQLSSKLWAIRERAALLAASRVPEGDQIHALKTHLLRLSRTETSNAVHGKLLACCHMFTRCRPVLDSTSAKESINSLWALLERISEDIIQHTLNPVVASTFLDLINEISAVSLNQGVFRSERKIGVSVIDDLQRNVKHESQFILLCRALALNHVYSDIERAVDRDAKDEDLNIQFGAYVDTDQDVAKFVIEESMKKLSSRHLVWLRQALADLVLTTKSHDILAAAITGLAQYPNSAWKTSQISELTGIASKMNMACATNRDLWNAQILVAARLIQALGYKKQFNSELFRNFINAAELSQRDETEMPTRNAAMEAVVEVTYFMFDRNQNDLDNCSSFRLCLSLLLYEFLNDDDDEIRSQVAVATYQLDAIWCSWGQNIPFCAAAAREGLIRLFMDDFATSCVLGVYACMKVVGAQPSVAAGEPDRIVRYCQTTTVSAIIGGLLRQATDLFAEERQNLYVDDLTEIISWADVVARCGLDMIGETAVHTLVEWTCDGLQYLKSMLELQRRERGNGVVDGDCANDGSTKPLGLTYNAEILIVFIRVITMAGLLQRHMRPAAAKLSEELRTKNQVEKHLQSLQVTCRQEKAHEHIQVALERSLKS